MSGLIRLEWSIGQVIVGYSVSASKLGPNLTNFPSSKKPYFLKIRTLFHLKTPKHWWIFQRKAQIFPWGPGLWFFILWVSSSVYFFLLTTPFLLSDRSGNIPILSGRGGVLSYSCESRYGCIYFNLLFSLPSRGSRVNTQLSEHGHVPKIPAFSLVRSVTCGNSLRCYWSVSLVIRLAN